MDWARVGDYDAHSGSQPQKLQRRAFPLKIRHRVIVEDSVGFQEAVCLDSSEPEHFAELRLVDAASPEFFKGERFKGPAR